MMNIYINYNKIFGNIVIAKLIYDFVKLYKKNQIIFFDSIEKLKSYKEREFIETLIFSDIEHGESVLKVGDLPIGGVLKEVNLPYCLLNNNGNAIPFGVTTLIFDEYCNCQTFKESIILSTLPSTISKIKNVSFLNKNDCIINNNSIPSNIKSISFLHCPNISSINRKGNGFIKIPNTIQNLKFKNNNWNNKGIPIRKGDIPFGIKNLVLQSAPIEYDDEYDDNDKYILPESLIKLSICYNSHLSNLYKCNSIKKLRISFNNKNHNIEENSLPTSLEILKIIRIPNLNINIIPNGVTFLKLQTYSDVIPCGAFPNSITSLTINIVITEIDIFPESLTNLEILCYVALIGMRTCFPPKDYYSKKFEKFQKMLQILPKSTKSLIIPNHWDYLERGDFNLIIPNSIMLKYRLDDNSIKKFNNNK